MLHIWPLSVVKHLRLLAVLVGAIVGPMYGSQTNRQQINHGPCCSAGFCGTQHMAWVHK